MKRILAFVLLLTCLLPLTLPAQGGAARAAWSFTTRVLATGSSDHSEPDGFMVYSAFTLEAALRHTLSRSFAAELSIRTESREVDSLVTTGEDRRLGSLELLPINLFLQYRFRGKRVHPYVGAGLSATIAWEKSGALDSTDMKGSLGPAVQVGADLNLSPRVLLNTDLKWNRMRADLKNGEVRMADIRVDPLSLGVGLEFLF